MKEIDDFVCSLGRRLSWMTGCIVKKFNRYYLLSEETAKTGPQNFFFAGVISWCSMGTGFFPVFFCLTYCPRQSKQDCCRQEDCVVIHLWT